VPRTPRHRVLSRGGRRRDGSLGQRHHRRSHPQRCLYRSLAREIPAPPRPDDEHRVNQRVALVELLATGREWTTAIYGLAVSGMVTPSASRLLESVDKLQMQPLSRAYERALLTARILIEEVATSTSLTRLSGLHNEQARHIAPLFASRDETDQASIHMAAADATHYAKACEDELNTLERLARALAAAEPPSVRRRLCIRSGRT
jgi:hypothetical protein